MVAGITSAGFAPFIPTNISGCILWLRADKGIVLGTGVSAWNDLSGNNQNVTQSTGNKQPTYNSKDAQYNNQPTLSFLGSSFQELDNSSFSASQPNTWYFVGNCSTTSAFSDGTGQSCLITATALGAEAPNFSTYIPTTPPPSNPTVAVYIFNSTTSAIYANNSNKSINGGNYGTNGITNINIGGAFALSDNMTGKIAEVIIYKGAHTNKQIEAVMNYAGSRYDIGVI